MQFHYQEEIDPEGTNWSNVPKNLKAKYNIPKPLDIWSPAKTIKEV